MANEQLDILVLDDDLVIGAALEIHIEDAGGSPALVDNVQAAIDLYDERKAAGQPFHGVISDVNTKEPEVSGLDLARHVIGQDPEIPIYLVTAHEPSRRYGELATQIADVKVDGVIPKPWAEGQIEGIVGKIREKTYGTKPQS